MRSTIARFFEPESIAVIASLKETWFGGYTLIKNLLVFGFPGKIYPVNPSYSKVLDMQVYPSIKEVPEAVDLAIIITPRHTVPGVIKQCAENGVKAVIITSDGFAERDQEGSELQQEIVNIAKRSSIRILGPNTVGTANFATGLVTTHFATGYEKVRKGSVAFCAQSGIAGAQAFPLEDIQYWISKICDFGNKCDVDETDILEYLADDPDTKVIAMHIEDVKDGQRFVKIATEVVRKKPVLMIKPGRTKEAKKALRAHTGALAGEDQIYEAAFKQTGIIRVENFEELLNFSKLFALQPLPRGNNIAIITTSGGGGILAIDTAIENGLAIAELSDQSTGRLKELSPTLGTNPIDIFTTSLVFEDMLRLYQEVMEIALSDHNVDCAAIVLYEAPFTVLQQHSQIVEAFNSLKKFNKPVTIWLYGTRLSLMRELSLRLENSGFPVYSDFITPIKALATAAKYSACSPFPP